MREPVAPEKPCPGCGALFAASDGPTHRYLGASAGCWDLYGQMLAGVFPFRAGRWAQSLIDAYAAQHPGVDGPQARQSVAVHMVALHARIADGLDVTHLNDVRVAGAEWGHRNGFEWLEPAPEWPWTIASVAAARDEDRGSEVDRYVESVYEGWMTGFGSTIEEWHRAIRGSMLRGSHRAGRTRP